MTVSIQPPIVRMLQPRPYASKQEVIEAIGQVMTDAAAVTRAYVDGMLRKEQEASTIVTAGVALPHGTSDVRNAVLRNVLVVAAIPGGVEWRPDSRCRWRLASPGPVMMPTSGCSDRWRVCLPTRNLCIDSGARMNRPRSRVCSK